MEKLIKNGNVVFETAVRKADILIRGEKIAAILAPGEYSGSAEVIDADGLYVMPGTIDPHQHLAVEILHRVGDQAVLTERHHDVVGRELVVGEEVAVEQVVAAVLG